MRNESDRYNLIILDVFEIVNYKPILKYKISVVDKFIILVSNKDIPQIGVSKYINKQVNERLILYELTDDEKSILGIPLTHKFQIKQFSKYYLFLNLTDNDLINLGFKEPQIVISKTEKLWIWTKKFHKTILWVLAGILLVLSTSKAIFDNLDILKRYLNPKESIQSTDKQNIDDNNILKTDSLTKKLK